MIDYGSLAEQLGRAWRQTHPQATERELVSACNLLTVLVKPMHGTLFYALLERYMRGEAS